MASHSILQVQGYTTGGSAEHTVILCRGFRARGWNVTVACPAAPNRFTRTLGEEGIEIVPVPLTGKGDWQSFRRLVDLVRSRRFECVHTHSRNADWVGLWAAQAAGAPLALATLHGWIGDRPGNPARCVKSRAHAWTLRMAADHVIAISHAVKRHAVEDYRLAEDAITVVHNGSERPPHQPLDIGPASGRLVVSIGSLHPSKNFLGFIDVAAQVSRHVADIRFAIIGEGPERERLARRIAELGLEGRVILMGHRDDVATVLRTAAVYVSTSEWEGFGRTLTEAMAVGVPVVARRAGAMPEIVDHGVTGFVCGTTADFAAAITMVLADATLARRMGRAGRERFERLFTADVNVDATVRVVQDQLAQRGREGADDPVAA